MKQAYIWDLDGTLLDSYPVIVSSLYDACRAFGAAPEKEKILRCVISASVRSFLQQTAAELGLPEAVLRERYTRLSEQRSGEISPVPGAAETLEALAARGAKHYVFTHRGASAEELLRRLGLLPLFEELVTALSPFPRKPAPDALLYLIGRHALPPERTFYVGDRTLDMDCARNARIRGILLLPPGGCGRANGAESRIIRSLPELLSPGEGESGSPV